jgi:hypothetical protein
VPENIFLRLNGCFPGQRTTLYTLRTRYLTQKLTATYLCFDISEREKSAEKNIRPKELINSMEQSPSLSDDNRSAGQEIIRFY